MKTPFLISFFGLVLIGCSNDPTEHNPMDPNVEEFQIGADRIEVPSSVEPTEKIVVSIYGNIGHNGAYRFDRMEMDETRSKIEMTAIGTIDKSGRKVTQALVEWQGREFIKKPPHEGPVTVIFNQPDGTTLEKTVEVSSK